MTGVAITAGVSGMSIMNCDDSGGSSGDPVEEVGPIGDRCGRPDVINGGVKVDCMESSPGKAVADRRGGENNWLSPKSRCPISSPPKSRSASGVGARLPTSGSTDMLISSSADCTSLFVPSGSLSYSAITLSLSLWTLASKGVIDVRSGGVDLGRAIAGKGCKCGAGGGTECDLWVDAGEVVEAGCKRPTRG